MRFIWDALIRVQELAPVIEFLRTRLQLTPPHVDTQPHETPAELEAQAPEVV